MSSYNSFFVELHVDVFLLYSRICSRCLFPKPVMWFHDLLGHSHFSFIQFFLFEVT